MWPSPAAAAKSACWNDRLLSPIQHFPHAAQVVFAGPTADLPRDCEGEFAVARLPKTPRAEGVLFEFDAAAAGEFLLDFMSRNNARHSSGSQLTAGDISN